VLLEHQDTAEAAAPQLNECIAAKRSLI